MLLYFKTCKRIKMTHTDKIANQTIINTEIKSLAKEKLLETLFAKYGLIITSKEIAEIFSCTRSDLSFISEQSLPVIRGKGQGASKYLLDHVVSHILGEPCYTVPPSTIFDRLFPEYGVVLKTREAIKIFKVSRQELATVSELELPVVTHIGRGVKRYMLNDISSYISLKMSGTLSEPPTPQATLDKQSELPLAGVTV